MKRFAVALAVACSVVAFEARADDISDQINEALKAYERHDLATTTMALDAANSLLRQVRADAWKAMLPEPLAGWTAKDAESTTVANALMGGGTSVSRSYHQGNKTIDITFLADSPMMQGLGSLLTSGIVSGNDAKVMIIDGRRVTYNKSENSYMTSAGKVMVTVKAENGADDASLRAYLKAIKFAEIEKASAS